MSNVPRTFLVNQNARDQGKVAEAMAKPLGSEISRENTASSHFIQPR
jgi:hypothetical protein